MTDHFRQAGRQAGRQASEPVKSVTTARGTKGGDGRSGCLYRRCASTHLDEILRPPSAEDAAAAEAVGVATVLGHLLGVGVGACVDDQLKRASIP